MVDRYIYTICSTLHLLGVGMILDGKQHWSTNHLFYPIPFWNFFFLIMSITSVKSILDKICLKHGVATIYPISVLNSQAFILLVTIKFASRRWTGSSISWHHHDSIGLKKSHNPHSPNNILITRVILSFKWLARDQHVVSNFNIYHYLMSAFPSI